MKKKVFTFGIATSAIMLLSATIFPSSLAYAESIEKQELARSSLSEVEKDASTQESTEISREVVDSDDSTTTVVTSSSTEQTVTSESEEPTEKTTAPTDSASQQVKEKENKSVIEESTKHSETKETLISEENSLYEPTTNPSAEMGTSSIASSNEETEKKTVTTPAEMQEPSTRRKREQRAEHAMALESAAEEPIVVSFDEKAFDAAVDNYIDNANEEELTFVVDAGNEKEMTEALEYLLLNQIDEEYGIEQLAELKKYLTAEEIDALENEPSVEKFETILTKYYDEREKKLEAANSFNEFFETSTDAEIDQMLQAKDEKDLEQIVTALIEKREQENKGTSDRNKRFVPIAIPLVVKGAAWVIGLGVAAYAGHQTYQALEKQRAEKKRMVARWKYYEKQAKARQQAAQRAKAQAVARARAQAAARAQKQANQRARAQAAQRARAQAALWAKQQAAARARAKAAANARRQSTARPYITTKPRPKPVIKAKPKPVAKPKPTTKLAAKPKPKPEPVAKNTTHKVSAGESVWSISNKYGISMNDFIKWNNIKNNLIHPGQQVIVKKTSTPAKPAAKPATKPSVPDTYQVKPGDSVWGIAEKYGLSVAKFVQWNNIKNNTIHPGQTMYLKDPKATAAKPTAKPATKPAPAKDTNYTVKAGDSVWLIANMYGISMNELIQWNNIKNNLIHPGQKLVVKKASVPAKPTQEPVVPTTDVTYKTTYGDSLWLIASKHGVTIDQLRKLNGIKGDLIHPGQMIVVKKGTAPAVGPSKPTETNSTTYTVKSGDSVWLIANRYGVSMDELVQWNNIKNYTIHPGQKIIVENITNKEAQKAAEDLGYQKTNERSHGQPVFKNAKRKPKYITPDADSHNGGTWKGADSVKDLGSKDTRSGTYDKDLNRIGD